MPRKLRLAPSLVEAAAVDPPPTTATACSEPPAPPLAQAGAVGAKGEAARDQRRVLVGAGGCGQHGRRLGGRALLRRHHRVGAHGRGPR